MRAHNPYKDSKYRQFSKLFAERKTYRFFWS